MAGAGAGADAGARRGATGAEATETGATGAAGAFVAVTCTVEAASSGGDVIDAGETSVTTTVSSDITRVDRRRTRHRR